jgi:SAM-dependent methyltransferase
MFLTKKSFYSRVDNLNSKYWKEGKKYRWQYMSYVIEIMESLHARNTLEAGSYFIPLNHNSFLIELEKKFMVTGRGIIHDLNVTPYPIPAKTFDCAVALQVWEHLENQQAAFREFCRISRNVILSFPYKWTWGDAMHKGIDDAKISKWTCGVKPSSVKIINHRMICLWRVK